MPTSSLYGLDEKEITSLVEEKGLPSFRAKQILEWLYKKNITSFNEARTLPEDLRKKLAEEYQATTLTLEEAKRASDSESTKFLYKTYDGRLLESVLIEQTGRRTLCVSTQLGCKVGCIFCASGKGKFGRNLTVGEVVEQVALSQREIKNKVTNIVFMGMGEPLDNFEVTMKALEILQAKWGFDMGSRRITVSTSGITPKIVEFVNRNEGRVRLSVSLHSSDEAKRTELVPINKKYSLKELTETLLEINQKLKREITFEYTLIAGQNDSPQEAAGVGRLAKLLNAKVNIIPYNPIREMDFKRPKQDVINLFRDTLKNKGVRVTVRQTAGREIDAACGQLRLDRESE